MAFDFFAEDNNGNLFTNPMAVAFTVTTTSGGAFSADITNAGLTHVRSVSAQCLNSGSGVTNATVTSLTGVSTTTISGNVYQFTQNLGILNLAAAASGKTVHITVIGDQA